MSLDEAKAAIDRVIRIGRIHLYKPIQIAEILHRSRTHGDINVTNLETYRNPSKTWRDSISLRLVGNISTSSQKYQDNLFEENAVPPRLLVELDRANKEENGIVENYIYHKCKKRWSLLIEIKQYLDDVTPESFQLKELVSRFEQRRGLKRSIDKIFEIVVYALFVTIVRELEATVSLEIENPDPEVISDFEDFIKVVLGVAPGGTRITVPATLYRAGVANAADLGIDILTNFGPIVQVKHLSLTREIVEDIAGRVSSERIVIVCKDHERPQIQTLLHQIGWSERIQGIITLTDLNVWYEACLGKYRGTMGQTLMPDLRKEYSREFPLVIEIDPFMRERGYDTEQLEGFWAIE
jgi:type II restriction enzyme